MEELKKREIPKIKTHKFQPIWFEREEGMEDHPDREKCDYYLGGDPTKIYAYCNETKENHEE